jgi:predicted nucleic acid-binding protein
VTVYVDASILLRVVLGQSNALADWRKIRRGISSTLIRTECLRTLDRLRLTSALSDVDMSRHRAKLISVLNAMDLVELDASVLSRAEQPMPTSLGTLDAIHLATALL